MTNQAISTLTTETADQVFDPVHRADESGKLRAESDFSFLNRSGWEAADRVRSQIESWYQLFPAPGRKDIRGRLRSDLGANFDSAFHELVLNAAIGNLGCTVDIHPVVTTRTTNPDFLVHNPQTGDFYLEAVCPNGSSPIDIGGQQRTSTLLDLLDRRFDDPDFWLGIQVLRRSARPGSAKRFAAFIRSKLDPLRPQCSGHLSVVSRFLYEEDEWGIGVTVMPKAPAWQAVTGAASIGVEMASAQEINPGAPLRKALETKAKKCGSLDAPFVIAVNTNESFAEQESIEEALYGERVFEFVLEPSGQLTPTRITRKPDGLWRSTHGPRCRQVSAVLFTTQISPRNLGRARTWLYLSPAADRAYYGELLRLTTVKHDSNQPQTTVGVSLNDILGIEANWPWWPIW